MDQCTILQCTLPKGTVLKELKRRDIVPLCKSGHKEEPLIYRLVPLTTIIYNLCESLKQWVKYMQTNKIVTDRQLCFREGRLYVPNKLSYCRKIAYIT